MAYPDLEKARECHGALRDIFIHHPGGWADKEALFQVEKLAWRAMTVVKDAEAQEKMGIVEHYAAALYSEDDFLRLQILRALVAFHGRLLAIEAARRNGLDPDPTPLWSSALPRDADRPS
jgi:hypothetical protein